MVTREDIVDGSPAVNPPLCQNDSEIQDVDVLSTSNEQSMRQAPTITDSQPVIDHMLLVLSDSALPLGSFAFSSGLESYIAHRKLKRTGSAEVEKFLALSLASVASATLPYVLAAFRCPENVLRLDNELDASTLCHVARRASVAQGRALIGVWERSLADSVESHEPNDRASEAQSALTSYCLASRGSSKTGSGNAEKPSGHLAPLWGATCAAMCVSESSTAYIYLFKHAQSVLSAAVRASAIGPYQAQAILASKWLQARIQEALKINCEVPVEDAAQVVPMMDFWIALHDKLYTKIFNS